MRKAYFFDNQRANPNFLELTENAGSCLDECYVLNIDRFLFAGKS